MIDQVIVIGKRVYQFLLDEEQQQIDYLLDKLEQWEIAGKISSETFQLDAFSSRYLARCTSRLKSDLPAQDEQCELNILRSAMDVDNEVTAFLEKIKNELPDETHGIFERFIEIEEGHAKVLQAEIDYIEKMGFWFDIREFDLE